MGLAKAGMVLICIGGLVLSANASNVTMHGNDGAGTSSFNSAGRWNNSTAPMAGNDYFTSGYLLRSPATGSSYTFAGDTLSVDSGGRLLGKSSSSTAPGQVLTVDHLILNGGSIDQANTPNYMTLAGGISVNAASSLVLSH